MRAKEKHASLFLDLAGVAAQRRGRQRRANRIREQGFVLSFASFLLCLCWSVCLSVFFLLPIIPFLFSLFLSISSHLSLSLSLAPSKTNSKKMAASVDTRPTTTDPGTEESRARASKAKATINKHESILFKIKLEDATHKKVPVYEVANKMIGFFCSRAFCRSNRRNSTSDPLCLHI